MYTCLSPKKIYNRYLGEYIWTDCRECDACRNKRSHELVERVEREHDLHRFCFMVTLTYDNAHLPVYTSIGKGCSWLSNRQNYDVPEEDRVYEAIDDSDVAFYPRPQGYHVERAFAHICIEDIVLYLANCRSQLRHYCKTHNIDYNTYAFRYFLCAEYGPSTFRPHYHLLVWFEERSEYSVLSEILSKSWKAGDVRIDSVTTNGVSNYVASYVNSSAGVPEVLRAKSVRSRCTFSKFPSVGAIQIDDEEIQEFLREGASKRVEWDDTKKAFIPYVFPTAFYRRYFPKCQGFNTKNHFAKLRVYSYVFQYFCRLGITHTAKEVEEIKLKDIPWPTKKELLVNHLTGEVIDELTKEEVDAYEWSYTDKYCSLVAYLYCVKFNLTPEFVLSAIERIYQNCSYV